MTRVFKVEALDASNVVLGHTFVRCELRGWHWWPLGPVAFVVRRGGRVSRLVATCPPEMEVDLPCTADVVVNVDQTVTLLFDGAMLGFVTAGPPGKVRVDRPREPVSEDGRPARAVSLKGI